MKEKIIETLVGVIMIAFAISVWVIGLNIKKERMEDYDALVITQSFEETLNEYVEERYGNGYYAKIFNTNDGYVNYDVYAEDGELISTLSSTYIPSLYN